MPAIPIFSIPNILNIGLLVFLEGALSLDNALVLALLVRPLPEAHRKKALTYGIAGAFGFRFISLFFLNYLTRWPIMRLIAGGYLIILGLKHFGPPGDANINNPKCDSGSFLKTIITVELLDLAFSADSILASVAVSRDLRIVFIGGVLGIIMMRFAAKMFCGFIERYPKLETFAYLLVIGIGVKTVWDFLKMAVL